MKHKVVLSIGLTLFLGYAVLFIAKSSAGSYKDTAQPVSEIRNHRKVLSLKNTELSENDDDDDDDDDSGGDDDDDTERNDSGKGDKIRKLPQAIIIGAKKAGTCALRRYLNQHPDIRMPSREVHFFDNPDKYAKGLDHYISKMLPSYPHQITMEKVLTMAGENVYYRPHSEGMGKTPRYFVKKYDVAHLVYKHLGEKMKFILCVRDPVDRLHSDYFMELRLGQNKKTLDESVLLHHRNKVNEDYEPVQVSSYDDNMGRWLKYYPLHRFHFVENKDLEENPLAVLHGVADFLGIRRHFKKRKISKIQEKRNQTKHAYNFMSNKTRELLVDYFRPHSLHFFNMIGRTFNWKLHWQNN